MWGGPAGHKKKGLVTAKYSKYFPVSKMFIIRPQYLEIQKKKMRWSVDDVTFLESFMAL